MREHGGCEVNRKDGDGDIHSLVGMNRIVQEATLTALSRGRGKSLKRVQQIAAPGLAQSKPPSRGGGR